MGVISDTHGLLRPEALRALRGAAHILHAGDVGRQEILDALAGIAPVTAVRGNCDHEPWARRLPDCAEVELGGCRVRVVHERHRAWSAKADCDVVVFGHSHVASCEREEGVLFFNPGSAGPRRFRLPATVGELRFAGGRVRGRIVEL